MNNIVAFALTAFIAFWTARAALARGRSPWLWGGAALILGFLSIVRDDARWLNLLSVAPVLFLMLFARPRTQRPTRPPRNACPKCANAHSPGQNFCTKCGWDLSREYTPENGDTVLASEMRQTPPTERDYGAATMERPAETASAAAAAETPAESAPPAPAIAAPPSAETDDAPSESPNPPAPDAESEPAPPRPWGIPQPSPAPTAEQMTARGATLLSEGRIQEAIDQFTKAIALDPKHREAFERRAEAYTQQGRGERAAEDYRRIQALNAGS